MRLWSKKMQDLYVIQVDQRRLVDAHVDCLMKTVNSPHSPVPLNYTEEVARVCSKFEEDTYNLKKRWRTVLVDRDLSSRYVGRVTLTIGMPRSLLKPSYFRTKRFGQINWRLAFSLKPLTSLPTLVDPLRERASEKTKTIWGVLLFEEGRREQETVGDNTRRCMHGARLR